jgi:hypothetical protein
VHPQEIEMEANLSSTAGSAVASEAGLDAAPRTAQRVELSLVIPCYSQEESQATGDFVEYDPMDLKHLLVPLRSGEAASCSAHAAYPTQKARRTG